MTGLTYSEVGATAGVLPPGYHHVRVSRVIGQGRATFETASAALLSWQMHERSGVRRVSGPDRVVDGCDVGFSWFGTRFECRVVSVVDEDDRRGFSYGTLARHPERGEERFMVDHDPATGSVSVTITAFSRPANLVTRVAGPVARLVQARITHRYLHALG
jgi:uncharacterized protein (UPF0548 family)